MSAAAAVTVAPGAARLIRELRAHFRRLERPEAIRGLARALQDAQQRIVESPFAGLTAPRPYPHLARPGRLWLKSGRYWIAYTPSPAAILAVFYDTADIPSRQGPLTR